MGHHYVPQRYLRNFECPDNPGFTWQHDKRTGDTRLVSIKQAAQARNYYEQDVEQLLATEVESPTNPIIDKLIAGTPIDAAERHQLALYVATMLMRVPAHRRKALEGYPGMVADFARNFREQFESLIRSTPDADPAILARGRSELGAWAERHATFPPEYILEQIRSPWPYRSSVAAIEQMTWRVARSAGPQYFMTSDNPAFYFGSYGVGRVESELSFPLSTTHALHGSWQAAGSLLVFVSVREGAVREINRRLASECERAFYFEQAPWLHKILSKKRPFLSVIRWTDPPQWREPPAIDSDGERHVVTSAAAG